MMGMVGSGYPGEWPSVPSALPECLGISLWDSLPICCLSWSEMNNPTLS